MKFYVASGVENAERVSEFSKTLKEFGWTNTYDWTKHILPTQYDETEMQEIAKNEMLGVKSADVVFVLLPGGKGTHTELGIAIALKKPTIIWSETPSTREQCPFYHCSNVTNVVCDFESFKNVIELLISVVRRVQDMEKEEN